MCRDVLQAIRDLVRFRQEIRTAMIALNPELATGRLLSEPRGGNIECCGKTWTFRKHGAGYCFEAPGSVVEWCLWRVPHNVFEWHELYLLLESYGWHPKYWANKSGAVLQEECEHSEYLRRCLDRLAADGILGRTDKRYHDPAPTESAG